MNMTYEMHFFDIYPQVVEADTVREIRITPKFGKPDIPADAKIDVFPVDGLYEDGTSHNYCEYDTLPCKPLKSVRREGNAVVITAAFPGEQMHNIRITLGGYSICFTVYSLKPDLYALRPFRGDFHIHSSGSDGCDDPLYLAARYRETGFDFIAITDHRKMEPSRRSAEYWNDLTTGFQIFRGEELHLPDNPVHMVNFGGSFSVNELAWNNEAQYRAEVNARAELLTDVAEHNRFIAASCEWAWDQIRKGGGIAVFCHPDWEWHHAQHVISESLTNDLLKRRKFDVCEAVGGKDLVSWLHNNVQMARYYAEQIKGNSYPCVAVSDCHGINFKLGGWYSTLVLAKSDAFPDLADALRNGFCAAVRTVPDEQPEVIGNFRIMRYAAFLVRDYFPLLEKTCRPEGALMIERLEGNQNSAELLRRRGRETDRLRSRFFSLK